MNDPEATRWCPHCRTPTVNAPLPQLDEDAERIQSLPAAGDPRAFRRQLYCVRCRGIWETYELPAEFVQELTEQRQALHDARRQITLLRFYLAQARGNTDSAKTPEDLTTKPLGPLRLAG